MPDIGCDLLVVERTKLDVDAVASRRQTVVLPTLSGAVSTISPSLEWIASSIALRQAPALSDAAPPAPFGAEPSPEESDRGAGADAAAPAPAQPSHRSRRWRRSGNRASRSTRRRQAPPVVHRVPWERADSRFQAVAGSRDRGPDRDPAAPRGTACRQPTGPGTDRRPRAVITAKHKVLTLVTKNVI